MLFNIFSFNGLITKLGIQNTLHSNKNHYHVSLIDTNSQMDTQNSKNIQILCVFCFLFQNFLSLSLSSRKNSMCNDNFNELNVYKLALLFPRKVITFLPLDTLCESLWWQLFYPFTPIPLFKIVYLNFEM